MNVLVKHGTTNISSYVISYDREVNICTGIGTLELVLSGTYPTSIAPHDTFSIYENGDFKVTYYVSDVDRTAPQGTIRLQCQDKSKYLVDYFIPDQYVVDYPSYTRYWIEKFFTEAGISYSFTTSSQGNLLSNYTSLGLQPAYDQIMMLCQLSGWYFYFNGSGTAIVGSLTTDVSSAGSVNKQEILSAKKTTDDKMLRNRAVVWGQYDPLRREYAYADVSKNTPWNYDRRDKRSMVVSNNNIPNKSSAYSIANLLLKEFAKVTVVKEITIAGAKDYNLGEMLRVTSDVWSGRGLITSFNVSMSRSGLITKVLLDERCPRLFGFFNFGDYVYVGTFGDGVWRKHIRFDPTWYNFSTGLTDLQITDMHINNGVFGSVGSNGEMYYALYDLPWREIQFSGLESSQADTASGVMTTAVFSGLNARAVIVDKLTNTVKYAVDTYSGLNTGDFLGTYSGFMTASGITTSGNRSWIVEYDVLNGDTNGIPYPISISGNYNLLVLDIENDGRNDFVSVATMSGGSQIPSNEFGYNFGKLTSYPKATTWDRRSLISYNLSNNLDLEGQSKSTTLGASVLYSIFENQTVGERELVARVTESGVRKFKRVTVTKPFDVGLGRERVTFTTLDSPSVSLETNACGIIKIGTIYREFVVTTTGTTGSNKKWNVEYRDWDTLANTVSGFTSIATLDVPVDTGKGGSFSVSFGFKNIEDTLRLVATAYGIKTPFSFTNYVKIYSLKIDLNSQAVAYNGLVHQQDYQTSTGSPGSDWTINLLGPAGFTQVGENLNITIGIGEWNDPVKSSGSEFHNHLLYSHDGINFTDIIIQSTFSNSDVNFLFASSSSPLPSGELIQLTGTHYIWWIRGQNGAGTDGITYVYNGTTVTITNYATDVPYSWRSTNIYPVFGGLNDYYIVKNGSTFEFWNAGDFSLYGIPSFDARYTILKPLATASTYAQTYFWFAYDSTLAQNVILKTTGSYVINYIAPFGGFSAFTGTAFSIIAGNFVVDTDSSSSLRLLYLDNTDAQVGATEFLVLRRDEYDFVVIERESYPIRIDISNNSPLLTVGSGAGSFHSQFVYDTLLETVVPSPLDAGMNNEVNDYRYSLLETISGAVTTSGFPVTTQILMATGSGIMTADADTYSGGFTLAYSIPSGIAGRIETTNFTYPGQYIFVTTSGSNPAFYQKDNDKQYFDTYSGLPASRATIIRIDDYL